MKCATARGGWPIDDKGTATLLSRALRRWSLALLGAGIPFATAYVSAVLITPEAIRARGRWMRTPLDLPILALTLWLVIASVVAETPVEALLTTLHVIAAVYLFFQIPYRWFRAEPELMTVVSRWAALLVPVATAVAFFNFLWNPHLGIGAFRRFTLPDSPPAFLAWGLEVAMLLGLGLLDRRPWMGVTIIGVGLFGLIGTFSRWAMLGFGAGILTWSIVTVRQHPRRVKLALLSIVLTVVIVVPLPMTRAILVQYAQPSEETHRPIHALARGLSLHPGLSERIVIWRAALRIVRDHPWFGVGPGAFGRFYQRYRDVNVKDLTVLEEPSYLGTPHAHNEVLTIAAMAGIPAALAYLALLAVALRQGLARRAPASIPAVSALVAIVVHGLFDGLTTIFVGPLVVMWTLLALAVQPGVDRPGIVASRKNAITVG